MTNNTRLKATILLVDDSEVACEAVKHTLGSVGAEVVTLNSPFGFIKATRAARPQLILLDVGLGSVSGTKLVELGRQHAPRHCPIVLYSGREDSVLQKDVLSCNADGYISKSTTGTQLINAVRQLLNGARRGSDS